MNYNFINYFVTITRKSFKHLGYISKILNEERGEQSQIFKKYFFIFSFLIYGSKYACSKTAIETFQYFCSKNYSHHNGLFISRHRKLLTIYGLILESEKWLNTAKFWYVFEM